MAISLNKYVQGPLEASAEWKHVAALADELHRHLSTEEALTRIAEVNQPRRSSAAVQATFGEFVRDLGFESEKVGLFGTDEFALRPDYFLKLEGTGILLEVERGKSTITTWTCSTLEVSPVPSRALFVPLGAAFSSAEPHHVTQERVRHRGAPDAAVLRAGQLYEREGLCLFGY